MNAVGHAWLTQSVRRLEADAARSADTHLLRFTFPGFPGIEFYFKDESIHPTGSLKHRLARSLFLYALCNGWLKPGCVVVDASSGSTAISEAYFARLLELPYVAVMPEGTAQAKIREIEAYGGRCELIADGLSTQSHAAQLAARLGGHFLDQFANAERATDWRGNNNIAESIVEQLRLEAHAQPTWIVCGAGTGGTSATIGRYLRFRKLETRLCVADPEGAAFASAWHARSRSIPAARASHIEGIGRAVVEGSFVLEIADAVIEVPDAASCAGAWILEEVTGRRFGGSSGTNLCATLTLATRMLAQGMGGSLVTLLCDRGERYADTVFERAWLTRQGLAIDPWLTALRGAIASGGPELLPG